MSSFRIYNARLSTTQFQIFNLLASNNKAHLLVELAEDQRYMWTKTPVLAWWYSMAIFYLSNNADFLPVIKSYIYLEDQQNMEDWNKMRFQMKLQNYTIARCDVGHFQWCWWFWCVCVEWSVKLNCKQDIGCKQITWVRQWMCNSVTYMTMNLHHLTKDVLVSL